MNAFIIVFLLFYLLMLAFCVMMYVFQSLGMYTIAKRRGIRNPWLAWIPVGCNWLLGCISDQYQYVAKGREKSKRKILLGLSIASIILSVAIVVCYIWIASDVLVGLIGMTDGFDYSDLMEESMVPFMTMYGCTAIASIFSIVAMVFQYIAMYDLYHSCDPNNSVLFLILSIFLNVTQPFLIFSCRNKDGGMPPRRDQAARQPNEPPVWQPPLPPQEPWEQNTAE